MCFQTEMQSTCVSTDICPSIPKHKVEIIYFSSKIDEKNKTILELFQHLLVKVFSTRVIAVKRVEWQKQHSDKKLTITQGGACLTQ